MIYRFFAHRVIWGCMNVKKTKFQIWVSIFFKFIDEKTNLQRIHYVSIYCLSKDK